MTATPGPGTPSATAPSGATIWTSAVAAVDTYTVPGGVFSIRVDLWAAKGAPGGTAAGLGSSAAPGGGGYASTVIGVYPGQVVYISFNADGGPGGIVPNVGVSGLAWPGGAGGQAVDARVGVNDPSTRVLVAGGGGGGGGFVYAGGGSGAPGGPTQPPGNVANGGGYTSPPAAPTPAPGYEANGAQMAGAGAQGSTPGAGGAVFGTGTIFPATGGGVPVYGPGGAGGNGGAAGTGGVGGTYVEGCGGGGGGGGYFAGAGGGGGAAGYDTTGSGWSGDGGGGTGGTSWASQTGIGVKMTAGAMTSTTAAAMVTPNPPTMAITAPASQQVFDAAAGFSLGWAYAGPNGTLDQFFVRRRLLGSTVYQWWNGAGTWVATETGIGGGGTSYAVPAGAFPDGLAYEVTLAAMDSTLAVGPYSPAVIIQAQKAPTVVVTPTGGTITTQTPTISWVATLAPGCQQVSYEVRVWSQAVAVGGGFNTSTTPADIYDSGVVYSTAGSLVLPVVLPSSGEVFVAVQVTQNGAQPSTWTGGGFVTISVTPPAAPTVAVTPEATQPSVSVTVTSTGAVTVANLQRSSDGGSTWTEVRYADGAPINTPIVDYEAPLNTPLLYQARTVTAAGVYSAWATSPPVTVAAARWWFSDPQVPASGIAVSLQPGHLSAVSAERQTVYDIMGVSDPVVLSDALSAEVLTLALTFLDDSTWVAFKKLRAGFRPLLIRSPTTTGTVAWYVRLGASFTNVTDLAAAREGSEVHQVGGPAQVVAQPATQAYGAVVP